MNIIFTKCCTKTSSYHTENKTCSIIERERVKKNIPIIVIIVPLIPCTGEIEVTEPIVQGVKRKLNSFDVGTVCEQEVGLRRVLELHDEFGIETNAKNQTKNELLNILKYHTI